MSHAAQTSLARLEEIAGGANIALAPAALEARSVCGLRPSLVVQPESAAQIAEIIRFAAAEKLAVIPCGGGTKLEIGLPPSRYDVVLDLSRMNRVLSYDPQDLTLGVEPGVRIQDLRQTLAEQRQFLPLAVPFSDRATIGGVVAANSSSPLRHTYGSVRDFCLGMEFVPGEGTPAKSGGRVVKNVTGYDLHKLLIGSLGTLAVITRVNFRTFPSPPVQGTFAAAFSSAESAFGFCQSVSHSVLQPQIVEIADPGAARLIFSRDTSERITTRSWIAVVTAAGLAAVVDRHARELGRLATNSNAEEFLPLNDSESAAVLSQVCEFPKQVLELSSNASVFRISAPLGTMPSLLKNLREVAAKYGLDFFALARASGILYAAFLPGAENDDGASSREAAHLGVFHVCAQPETQASAILEWCPANLKSGPDSVWGPSRVDFELMRRVKRAFDPHGILAPGRFAGGI